MIYTTTRLLPAVGSFGLWAWVAEGSASDPANLLLLFSGASAVLGLTLVRRYWHIRNTSRSRRDFSLFA